jgi:hypothetical protein
VNRFPNSGSDLKYLIDWIMNKKKVYLLVACVAIATNMWAQTLGPTVFATTGSTAKVDGVQLDWTVGETSTATFTSENGGTILTQGLHQPERQVWPMDAITFSGKVFLQGAYSASAGTMTNALNSSGILQAKAAAQPYKAGNFTYSGTEKVGDGFFAAHPDIVDWVLVELRDATLPAVVRATRAAFVKQNGTLVDVDGTTAGVIFSGVTAGNYYVAIRHRNHLGIRSAAPVGFSNGAGTYDFTTAANSSFKSQGYPSTVNRDGVWLMRGGNANSNGNVKYNGPENDQDRILNFKLGGLLSAVLTDEYATEDVNMDGVVKMNGPDNDQNFLLNLVLGGLLSTIYSEQL